MPRLHVNRAELHYEEHGSGEPILCIHGTGSAGYAWSDAAERLTHLGRVIVYDRRGFTRSAVQNLPDTTTVAQHTDDALALLRALEAVPAAVIARSYGGSVALDLALRAPEAVRALVLLEAVPFGLSADVDRWGDELTATLERAAAERGVDAVGETLLREVLGEWESLPAALRELFAANSAAILAETRGGELTVTGDELTRIGVPTLVVSAADSPEIFRDVAARLASGIPGARSVRVEGGHLIDPADPVVQEFLSEHVRR
ncbi:MAG TPA: alpha/beta fold hydrolase [Gaiellaceae bacterium]|nr:alpha/beta fold hydrolase [Gaiellaceae bacterium]